MQGCAKLQKDAFEKSFVGLLTILYFSGKLQKIKDR